ncbi:hypothetical protein ACFX2I_024418 [Malus domestica]|uniref:Protodermal factor 1 n=1 Tax=Malus domestica TaxID=3750 RepID=A0A498HEZ2_MALDO|nr:hypothetical protein DVH24_027838 [Malus domestica]
MGRLRSNAASLILWSLVAGLLSQNLVISVMSSTVQDQKNYYSPPDPDSGSPPGGSHGTPSSPPSHGGGSQSPPSHGGGGSYNPTPSPPSNCGTPPAHHNPTPSHDPSTPSTPSTPSGGGYYYSPPPTYGGSPPTTPEIGTPPTPVILSPPIPDIGTPPIDPNTPTIPSPPFLPGPNSLPPFTCNYWGSHPTLIWGLLGWWGTLGNSFGVSSLPGIGSGTMSLPQALSNTRTDGLGELYRQGTAALLNAMVDNRFHFTTNQVRDSFVSALGSNKAAATQARVFKLANEGKLKPRA